jgi:toxin secretion/phage lysis holin
MENIKYMIPVKIEVIWGAAAETFGLLTAQLFGEWTAALDTLLTLMILDYISGLLAAYINPRLALNSQKGFKGIARKIFILLIVALAHHIDVALGTSEIITVAVWFYIGNEGLSIIENAAKAGVPIPDSLRNSLEQLSHQKKAREKRG